MLPSIYWHMSDLPNPIYWRDSGTLACFPKYCRDSEVGEVLSSECWRFRVFKANALELTMSLAFQRTRLHGSFANTRMRAQAMHHATAGAAAFSAARPSPTEPILFVLSLFVP